MHKKNNFKTWIIKHARNFLGVRNYERLKHFVFRTTLLNAKNVLTSRSYPLNIPLEPDIENKWKPYQIFLGPTDLVDSLSCHASTLVHGHSPHPPHKHREEEILLVLSGEVDIMIPENPSSEKDHKKRLRIHDLVYYPSCFAHTLQTVSREPANYLMLKWSGFPYARRSMLAFGHYNLSDFFRNLKIQDKLSLNVIFQGATEYLKKFQCHVSALKPKTGYRPHVDAYDVVIILLEGEVQTLNKILKPHSVIFYKAGEPHGMYNCGESVARYVVFEFHNRRNYLEYVKKIIRNLGKKINP
jgi:uncharacterized cupin superfamily protein